MSSEPLEMVPDDVVRLPETTLSRAEIIRWLETIRDSVDRVRQYTTGAGGSRALTYLDAAINNLFKYLLS